MSDTIPRWTQRILVPDPHGAARGRGASGVWAGDSSGGGRGDGLPGEDVDNGGDLTARDSFIMRRAKTDLTHISSNGTVGRSRLPIFVSNENARIWLDLGDSHTRLKLIQTYLA